jgi:hypothetical protein
MDQDYNSNMPGWAKKVDDFGPRRWHRTRTHKSRRGEYMGSIIWNLIWLYIVNKVPDWNLSFINDHYPTVLWALNLNIFIQIGAYAFMFLVDHHFVRHLGKIFIGLAGFLLLIILFYIYPFDFSGAGGWRWLDTVIPILFIIGMAGSAISVLSSTWKLIFWRSDPA